MSAAPQAQTFSQVALYRGGVCNPSIYPSIPCIFLLQQLRASFSSSPSLQHSAAAGDKNRGLVPVNAIPTAPPFQVPLPSAVQPPCAPMTVSGWRAGEGASKFNLLSPSFSERTQWVTGTFFPVLLPAML